MEFIHANRSRFYFSIKVYFPLENYWEKKLFVWMSVHIIIADFIAFLLYLKDVCTAGSLNISMHGEPILRYKRLCLSLGFWLNRKVP